MFDQPKKQIDRWVGQESAFLNNGAIDSIWYTFRAIADEITEQQKSVAIRILENYEIHWQVIENSIKSRFFLESLHSRLLLYVPALVGKDEYEYMLGYEFKESGILYSAFFAFNNGQLEWRHIDGG
ncbi:hypothetical protein KFE80_08855 [bacterium SCSIO 12696]|nr:hypothetical protein KFE80_08855 [bacterium SCSIO 12696]